MIQLVRNEPVFFSGVLLNLLHRNETLISNAPSSTLDEYALQIQVQYVQRVDYDHNCVVGHICEAQSDKYVAKHDSLFCINHIAEEK